MFFRQLIPALMCAAGALAARTALVLANPDHATTSRISTPSPFPQTPDGPGGAATWNELADPAPLRAQEEALPAGAILARRYNPAMAFVHRDIWPVPVSYAWSDGAPLIARVATGDGVTVNHLIAVTNELLMRNDWGDLPDVDTRGNSIEYRVDAPGDDRIEKDTSGWRVRWRQIMQGIGDAPGEPGASSRYRPTQYAHLFWLNRERGLLAIQYWFYYPYNEWINHHEGDWEHVNVILHGPTRLKTDADFRVVGYQFFFHEFSHEPPEVIRVGGRDPLEDHVVAYVGGKSRFFDWTGVQSGGSYPLPAEYPAAGGGFGKWRPADNAQRPKRFIRADDFDVVMLPEAHRVDVGLHPELTWLRLNFFAGQQRVHHNPLTLNGVLFASTPRQPARQETWNAAWRPPAWQGQPQYNPHALAIPNDWTPLLGPLPATQQSFAAARRLSQRRARTEGRR